MTEGLKNTRSKGNRLRHHPLLLPSPIALRGTTKQYKEKGCVSILPCVLQRKYRGGVRKDGGVKKYSQQRASPSPPAVSHSITGYYKTI